MKKALILLSIFIVSLNFEISACAVVKIVANGKIYIARKILEKENNVPPETLKKTLTAVHQEWFSPTTYSYICDLKSKTVYMYNFHNYEEEYVIELKEKLKEGKHYYDLPSLFTVTTEAAHSFQEIAPKDGSQKIEELINSEGIHKVLTWFEEAKDKSFTAPVYIFDENEINTLGYKYLSNQQYDETLTVFKINTKKNPESWNVWDSLAETYMEMGDRENAIKYYKKSLELNQKNNNAIKRLDMLQQDDLTISQYIEKFKKDFDLVSISVALVRDKEIVWKGAFGKADVDNAIDVTTTSLYPLGSVSKLFTGVSLLKLYEEGKVNLDDDVNNYLPFLVRNPKYPDVPITVRMLLTHSSSIGDYQELQYKLYHHGDPNMSLSDVNRKFFDTTGEYYRKENYLDFEPGTSWKYSNWNFALIGYVIERITGKPFNEYNTEVLLEPLEMNNSGWLTTDFDTTNCVMLYEKMDDGNLMRLDNLSTWPGFSDGSLKSSIEEASNFLMMMINKGEFNDKQILNPSAIEKMLKPQGIKNLPEGYLKDMGLVWHIGSIIDNLYFHTGEPRGSLMAMALNPKTNSGFVSFITGMKFRNQDDLKKWVDYLLYLSEQAANFNK